MVTVPVPSAVRPLVMLLKPSVILFKYEVGRLNVPAPPPMPMLVLAVKGWRVKAPVPVMVTKDRAIVSAVSVIGPAVEAPPMVLLVPTVWIP